MAEPNEYEIKLIMKITRATVILEGVKNQSHAIACPGDDPHIPGKCNCGASEMNTLVNKVLSELTL